MKLMQYGFRYFKGIEIFNAGQGIPDSERRVWFGQDDKVALNPLEPIYVTLPFGREPHKSINLAIGIHYIEVLTGSL